MGLTYKRHTWIRLPIGSNVALYAYESTLVLETASQRRDEDIKSWTAVESVFLYASVRDIGIRPVIWPTPARSLPELSYGHLLVPAVAVRLSTSQIPFTPRVEGARRLSSLFKQRPG